MDGSESTTGSGLRLSVLGELTATYDGAALDLGGPRQRAVLALLLLARGEVVPAERLAESVWGEDAPGNTAGALQSYVSHLRKRLQPGSAARSRSGVIVSEGTGYAVRLPREAVDAWRFEDLLRAAGDATDPDAAVALLDEALALWRGPALCDYADEQWAEAEVARLADLRDVAREQRLSARLDRGEAALLVPELEALVAESSLREERWRLLVLALYRSQRQADALAALRRAREVLAEELGVDPGPALRALEAEVLAQSPALDLPRQREPARPSVPAAPASSAAPVADELVDREREVAVLRGALDDLAAGTSRLVVVEGPAGIGKSRLLAEVRRLAGERSLRLLTARGSQLEKAFAFGAVRQLFEPEIASRSADPELLTGAAAPARGVFDLADSAQVDGTFAVLHGLYWLTVGLAGSGPLVLVVDDLQWCDSGSLRYLAYLVPRLEGVPVLVVGTIRTGERHDEEQLLAELLLDPAATVVRPAPLSSDGTAELVRARLGEDASPVFVDVCHRTTSGNPLLLRQLLRALEADGVPPDAAHADRVLAVGSRAISSMVLVRLRRLPPEATDVARAVAVLGDGAQLPAVAALADLTEEQAATALAVLTRTEIVRHEQPLGFVHPLVRDAVHRDIPPGERELRHERAAEVLRRTGAPVEQVAAQLLLAPNRADPETVAVLRSAARTAADRGASDSAVTYLRRALEEPPTGTERAEVLVQLGLAETLVDGPSSTARLAEAYPLVEDPRRRGELAIAIARTHVFASPPGTAAVFARAAASDLPEGLDDLRQGLVALERISSYMHGLDRDEWGRDAPADPVGDGYGAQMLASALAWEALIDGEDRERTIRLARKALEGDRLWKVDNGLFWVVAANSRLLAGDDLGDFWTRARAQAHARGSLFAALSVNLWAGFWHWQRGDLPEAVDCMRACDEQNRMWGTFLGAAYSMAFELSIHLDRGDLPAAQEIAEQARDAHIVGDGTRMIQLALTRLELAEGRPQDALARLDVLTDPGRVRNPVWDPSRELRARALHGLGRSEEASALAEEEVALLRRWGSRPHLGVGLRLLGELTGSAEPLREAVALLEDSGASVELARARVALARHPATADEPALALLTAALAAAQACDARGVRDDARAELRRRGVSVAADDARGPARSGTTRRVLELVRAGHDVHEVAQLLFLTPGTVRAVLDEASVQA